MVETEIKTGDLNEITSLLKQGKLKYIFTNPQYKEANYRAVWERGYVRMSKVEIKTISREAFNLIEYNGKLIARDRRTSVSSQKSQ